MSGNSDRRNLNYIKLYLFSKTYSSYDAFLKDLNETAKNEIM
jgi:hypothetical protein